MEKVNPPIEIKSHVMRLYLCKFRSPSLFFQWQPKDLFIPLILLLTAAAMTHYSEAETKKQKEMT